MNIDKLNMDIMNIPCNVSFGSFDVDPVIAYKQGHRDARHAACEVVLEHNKASGSDGTAAAGDEVQAKALANVIDYLVANGHMIWCGFDDDDEPWSSYSAEFQAILDLVRKALAHRAATSQPPALTGQAAGTPLADERPHVHQEDDAFTEWWNAVQACPEHTLITENAARATWHERARRANLAQQAGAHAEPVAVRWPARRGGKWDFADVNDTVAAEVLQNPKLEYLYAAPSPSAEDDSRDAERFRWIEEHCRTEGGGHGFTIFVPVDHEDIGCGIDAAMASKTQEVK